MSDELKPIAPLGKGAQQVGPALKLGQRSQMAAAAAKGEMTLPRLFNQLVIFLLDGSGSMTMSAPSGLTKGEELHNSVAKVLSRLQVSKNRNCFDITCRAFSAEDIAIIAQQPVTGIDLNAESFDPTAHIESRATYVSATLDAAMDEAQAYLEEHNGKQCRALIILLTDGDFHDEEKAGEIAARIRSTSRVTLSTIFYETQVTPEWEKRMGPDYNERCAVTLRSMASEATYFASTMDPEAIRKHMIKSISKVSQV